METAAETTDRRNKTGHKRKTRKKHEKTVNDHFPNKPGLAGCPLSLNLSVLSTPPPKTGEILKKKNITNKNSSHYSASA